MVEDGLMKVAVVVEPSYDELASLVNKMPVWIVESSENKSSATILRARKSDAPTDLTTFKVQDVSQRQKNCLGIIDAIELHHPEMSEVLVIGLDDTESVRQGFLNLGYALENKKDALIARRISN
jgi:hypothetical protein